MFDRYLEIKEKIKKLTEEKLELEKQIYLDNPRLNEIEEGTVSWEKDGYKISVIKKLTVKVDQEMADAIGVGFRKKYELDKKAYKNLDEESKKMVDQALITKPAKPTFKVEAVK